MPLSALQTAITNMHTEKYLHGLYGGLGLNGLSVQENKSLQNDIHKHSQWHYDIYNCVIMFHDHAPA